MTEHIGAKRAPRWTAEQIALLQDAMRATPDKSHRGVAIELSRALARTPEAIMNKLSQITGGARTQRQTRAGEDSKPTAGKPAVYRRRCLSCSGSFTVRSPFIRVCGECKKTGPWKTGIHA